MSTVYIETGATERIESLCMSGALVPITGKTDILLQVRRVSNGQFLDFADMTFKAAGWTTRRQAMSEVSAANEPGVYFYDLATASITNPVADDTYELMVVQSPGTDVKNLPQVGEIKTGIWVDSIAAIETKTAPLPAAPASEPNVDAVEAKVDTVITGLGLIQLDVGFLVDVAGGRWLVDDVLNQLILYRADNATVVARFNLLDKDGAPASKDVYERVRVP
jgi:hypothetical protein